MQNFVKVQRTSALLAILVAPRRYLWFPFLIVSLGFAGCSEAKVEPSAPPQTSGEADETPVTVGQSFADPDDAVIDNSDQALALDDDELSYVSPIEEALGGITDPKRLSLIYDLAYTNHAEFTQECLITEGFGDYVVEKWPSPTPQEFVNIGNVGGDLLLYGYGLTGGFRSQYETLVNDRAASEETHVNFEFIDSMSEEEFRAFTRTNSMCQKRAWELFPVPDSLPAEDLLEEIVEIQKAALAGPKVAAATTEWSTCMATSGFRYSDRDAAISHLATEAAPLEEILLEMSMDGNAVDHPEHDDFLAGLREFEQVELQAVQADVNCAQTSDLENVERAALYDAEQAWIEANLDRIALAVADHEGNWYDSIGLDG